MFIVSPSAKFIINLYNILSNCVFTELNNFFWLKNAKSECPICHKTKIYIFTPVVYISYLIPSLSHLQGFWDFLKFFLFLLSSRVPEVFSDLGSATKYPAIGF